MQPTKQLSILIVGDASVGKTCLLHTYTKYELINSCLPNLWDTQTTDLELGGQKYLLTILGTAGQEDFDCLRRHQYAFADAFILCYSCTERNSFDNIKVKWAPELQRECPNVPIILVATKIDLRSKFPAKAIPTASGKKMKKKIKAKKFLECSTKEFKNVNEVFEEAVRAIELSQNGGMFHWFSRCKCKK